MDHRKAAGGQIQELDRSITLRPAEHGEAADISALALRSKAHWGYDDQFMADCVDELTWSGIDVSSGTCWVAAGADGTLLGFCELYLVDGRLEVDALYVDPPAMGRGVGKTLWLHAEDVARKLGARAIGLDADPHAVEFYEQMGARIVGESPSGSIADRMLPRMEKQILSQGNVTGS